ncbi:MAG: sugar transferase [Verrucomicrobiales bacterium]
MSLPESPARDPRERVVFAGPPDDVRKLHSELPPEMRAAIEVVDEIDISTEPVERLVHCLHDKAVERVIFAAAHVHFGSVEKAIHACEEEGVEAWLSADFIQTAIARPNFDTIGDRLMLVFRSTPEFSWAILFKEFIDKTGALILLILSSPIWLFAAIGIKLSSPGPIIFRQTRGGRHGKPFTMLKFRTMRSDAEEIKKSLQASNQMDGPVFKLDDDPRIFKFGRFLRRKSIDELPQLLNVLAGDMSLVGPRPLPVYEVEKIEESKQRRRLSVKPGLTCLWQVSGRNEITSFEKWVELDLKYIDNWSIWLDIKILARTVPVVLMGSGAR